MTTSDDPISTAEPIHTDRLALHVVRPSDYALLAQDRADPRLWVDRGFSNPHGYLVADPGPLAYRLPMVQAHPEHAPYLLRVAVLTGANVIVGGAGFHSLPDDDGVIEIGFEVVPIMRRQGFGTEILHGMWGWVAHQSNVRTLRYSVGIDNVASQYIVRSLGFVHVGIQEDEIDGPEDVFELAIEDYLRRSR